MIIEKAIASREVGDDVWFKFKGACLALVNHHFTVLL